MQLASSNSNHLNLWGSQKYNATTIGKKKRYSIELNNIEVFPQAPKPGMNIFNYFYNRFYGYEHDHPTVNRYRQWMKYRSIAMF
jgi:hypothetical protein